MLPDSLWKCDHARRVAGMVERAREIGYVAVRTSEFRFAIFLQVAMHLSETYGDRAFSVVRGASITGKRWPIVGKRLHDEYPYIEAEVSSPPRLQ